MTHSYDLRFDVPLYTPTEASRHLIVPRSTIETWVNGYERRPKSRPVVKGQPIITAIPRYNAATRSCRLLASQKPMYSMYFGVLACRCSAYARRSIGCWETLAHMHWRPKISTQTGPKCCGTLRSSPGRQPGRPSC